MAFVAIASAITTAERYEHHVGFASFHLGELHPKLIVSMAASHGVAVFADVGLEGPPNAIANGIAIGLLLIAQLLDNIRPHPTILMHTLIPPLDFVIDNSTNRLTNATNG